MKNMKIAVIGANGKVGRLVVEEAVNRGLDVTAVVRGDNKTAAQHVLRKDAFDLTAADLAGFDAVVNAVGTWTPQTYDELPREVAHVAHVLAGTDVRFIVVGGAGSLFVDKDHTTALEDTPDFPDAFKGVSAAHGKALADLRTRDSLEWTYVSPAANFVADGPRTGEYQLAGEELTLNSNGKSEISYADYAIGIVDEIESAHPHIRERISLVSK